MSPLARRSLLIFDCDGVLVDSEILACGVQSRALTAYGLPISPDEVAARFLGASAKDMRAALEIDLGRPLPDDHEARCLQELFALFRNELVAVNGIASLVAAAKTAGYAQCVASSSSPERIRLALDVVGLYDAFAPYIYSSSMVSRGKPAPDLFLHAATSMGFEPTQCAVIEDSVNGVKAGRAAGMRVIGFCAGAHCQSGHADMLAAAGADEICIDARALSRALGLEGLGASPRI